MDTHRMATLLEAAGPATIRTLGDPEQAQPVGAGGWHQLVDQAIGGHAQLTTVIRQRNPRDREVCAAIRDGHAPQALADLQGRGRLHLSPDRSTAVKELVHAWDHHRRVRGMEGVAIVTDTDNATVDVLNALCQAKRHGAAELTGSGVVVTDRVTGRREHVHAGDRVRFIRPYLDRGFDGGYVANGTAGRVLTVDPQDGQVVVGCDDGHTVTLQPGVLEEAQPLRLGYASHALKLQGGQAAVVLVLPGGWQTSRQSAYSMATRCVEELHVFVDAETQQSGLYRDSDPIHALGERWMRAAGKLAAPIQRDHQPRPDGPSERSRVDANLVVLPPTPWELAANRAPELAGGREVSDGLGIDL
jgi:ATP-dependent exoDNAse (exonuclease V) alpha subunit